MLRTLAALSIVVASLSASAQESAPPLPEPTTAPAAGTKPKTVLTEAQPRVDACLTPGTPKGTVKVKFTITESGTVRDALVLHEASSLEAPEVQACVLGVLNALVFSQPENHFDEPFAWTFRLSPPPAPGAEIPFRGVVPEGYHLVTEPRWALIAPGIAAFAGGYGLSIAISVFTQTTVGLMPVIGPFLLAAKGWQSGGTGWGAVGDFFVDAFISLGVLVQVAAQVAGVTMIIVGASNPRRTLEADRPTLTIAPGAPGAPVGASVVGRF